MVQLWSGNSFIRCPGLAESQGKNHESGTSGDPGFSGNQQSRKKAAARRYRVCCISENVHRTPSERPVAKKGRAADPTIRRSVVEEIPQRKKSDASHEGITSEGAVRRSQGDFSPKRFKDPYHERIRDIIKAQVDNRVEIHPASTEWREGLPI
jgi:hypothetical protein